MFGYIYETTNLINGKKYIGKKTSNVFLENNYLGSGIILHKAIEKYGKENFSVRLIEEISTNQEDLCKREIYWIDYYNAIESDRYYNIGAGGIGWNNSVNLRKDIDNSWLGRHHTDESKKKMSNSHKGKLWTEAQRKVLTPTRQGVNNSMYGKHHTEETKNKIKNSLARHYLTSNKKVWVSTDLDNKLILEKDLDKYLNLGYSLGINKAYKDKISKKTREAINSKTMYCMVNSV